MDRPNKKYMVNNHMFWYGLGYGVFLLVMGITLITTGRPYSALIFSLLSLPFFFIALRYGSVVVISKEGVSVETLFVKRKSFSWDEVQEVAVIGSRVFNKGKAKKCGTLYLIFSKEVMDDQKRFDLMVNWPPKDKIYMKFSKERMFEMQWYYTKPLAKYNIGMLDI